MSLVPQKWIRVKAPAKINLHLKITGRRDDGYHTLETLMQKVDLFDVLDMHLREDGISLRCVESDLPENCENLVYQAAELFLHTFKERLPIQSQGVELVLHKNIPVAAGLGGGSSDAAAVLLGLDALFSTCCSKEELAVLGIQLGADVPFFLAQEGALWATGIGEVLTPVLPLTGFDILLVNPGFPVSTKWAYENFTLTRPENESSLNCSQKLCVADLLQDKTDQGAFQYGEMINDLEKVTVSRYTELVEIKKRMLEEGADVAMMSGSGPTVFGLFSKRDKAKRCHRRFTGHYRETFLVSPVAGMQ